MKKIISFVGLFAVLGVGIGDAHGVAMSAQVRRLLQEKQEKIEQLEKCEGKKQGWMIAGISTIGLTAVGVGVNIAQASKSNRLSSEIEMEKSTLERHQNELNRIQNDIAAERAKQSEANKCCDMKSRCCECEKLNEGNCPGDSGDGGTAYDYSKYKLDCDSVVFTFVRGTEYEQILESLNKTCKNVTSKDMERTENNGFVTYECKNYKVMANCGKKQNDRDCPDITYSYAWPLPDPYASKIKAKLEEYRKKCEDQQGGSFEYVQATTGTGEIAIGGGKAVCRNRTKCDSNEKTDVHIDVEQEGVNPVKPEKDCRTSHGKKPTTDCPCDGDKGLKLGTDGTCQCEKTGETWNGSNCVKEKKDTIAERVLGQPCWKSDLPTDATDGIYWEKPGKYKCKYNDESVLCSCRVDKCKDGLVADESHEKCVKKNLVTDCSEGYVRIGGNGDCVKRDYLFTDQCKCAKDPSKMCKLDTDHGGDLVCQLAKGIGKKCKCEDCPKGEEFDPVTKKCGTSSSSATSENSDCVIGEPNKILPEGCVCDASKGLVERWVTTMFGGRGNQKECKCDSGTRWDGRENMCI